MSCSGLTKNNWKTRCRDVNGSFQIWLSFFQHVFLFQIHFHHCNFIQVKVQCLFEAQKLPNKDQRNFPISCRSGLFFWWQKVFHWMIFAHEKKPTIECFIPLRPGGPCDDHFGLHLCCDRNLCSMSTIQPEVGAVGWMVRTVLGVGL